MTLRACLVVLLWLPSALFADDRLVRLHAPAALVESGLLEFILPRFKLKTQVRVEPVATPGEADMVFGDTGRALFSGLGATWKMELRSAGHPGTDRFADWLTSDIGQRTIASFAPEGEALFGPPETTARVVAEVSFDGDAEEGHKISRSKCTRCHAVDSDTRGWGIGSTPSFGVLRALPDWEERFTAFYALNPHPSFTQIEDVTEPFPINRPSPIAPVMMTLDEVEALLAYVAQMQAADLGAPIQSQ